MSHIVDAHVAYIKAIADLSRDKAELLERIKRLEEMYEGVIGERPELLGSNVMGLLKRELNTAQRRIKRLEEAGDELIWAFCPASVSMMTERESDALKLWNKAKEAKP